ncbi:MAG: twin-arginine translocase subunit TatC [Microbacteriaceae bacterium]
MSLAQHLLELRRRLFIAAGAILVGAILGFIASDFILGALMSPINRIADARNAVLNFATITGSFDLKMQIALYTGVIISSPVWLWQIWAFIIPGLTRKEKRYGFGFFFAAIPLFFLGCVAGWYVLPNIVSIMTGFAPESTSAVTDAKLYFDFVLKLVLAVGIAFVLPVFVVLLNFVGVLSASAIIKGWRWAILLITLFTAIATPAADVMSMFLLAIPMVLLYFIAAGIAWLHDRRAARRADALIAVIE